MSVHFSFRSFSFPNLIASCPNPTSLRFSFSFVFILIKDFLYLFLFIIELCELCLFTLIFHFTTLIKLLFIVFKKELRS